MNARIERKFDRMRTAPNREVEFTPGPDRPTTDWRAVMQPIENWLPVSGYEGLYEVSDQGGVRSLDRILATPSRTRSFVGKVRKPSVFRGTYLQVPLTKNGKTRTIKVHRMVAQAFVPGESPGLEVCHSDGDSFNNAPSNLRWDTKSANSMDSIKHGTHSKTSKTHCKNGHEYTPENTGIRANKTGKGASDTWRECNECLRLKVIKRTLSRRAARRELEHVRFN